MGTSGPARALRFGSATLTVTTMYTLLITFFTLAIVFSFLCSLWEAVLLSITPAYAEIQKQHGSAIGRHLCTFKSNIDGA